MSEETTFPSRWGHEDEAGALNLQTSETVTRAAHTVKTGQVYQLGIPIRRSGAPHVAYRPVPQRLTLVSNSDEAMLEPFGGQPGTGSHEDVLIVASHEATHMDALGHVYQDGAMYNGWPNDSATTYDGLSHCGIEKAGPIVARAVMLDVPRALGRDLPPGYIITEQDLKQTMALQETRPLAGDVVLIRTGWIERFAGDMEEAQPGIGLGAAQLLAEFDPIAVGSDNSAIEAMPFDGGVFMPVHIELLARHGVYLVEHLNLEALARDGHHTMMFVCSPLQIVGASGSPVNPVAIV